MSRGLFVRMTLSGHDKDEDMVEVTFEWTGDNDYRPLFEEIWQLHKSWNKFLEEKEPESKIVGSGRPLIGIKGPL